MRRALVLLTIGCAAGPNVETQIDELRVVAAVAEPPEVATGESYALTVTVADPAGAGFDSLVWTCPPGEDCVREPLAGAVEMPGLPFPVWIVACEPGLCDLEAVTDVSLADPVAWLEELPLTGVSAAVRTPAFTELPLEERRENPVVEEAPEAGAADRATVEAPVTLRFVVPGAETAYGSATGGGFGMASYDVASDGAVALAYYAPEEGGARLYVVFEDGLGGTAVWTADRAP